MRLIKRALRYTLIELLVTITVVAILMTVLFGVMAKGIEQTKLTTCKNNMKNIDLCITQYLSDHRMKYPAPTYESGGVTFSFDDYLSAYDGRPLLDWHKSYDSLNKLWGSDRTVEAYCRRSHTAAMSISSEVTAVLKQSKKSRHFCSRKMGN